jgi:hypothetical protein
MEAWVVVRVNDGFTVDLMTAATGIGVEEAQNCIEWQPVDGVPVPFADAALMLWFKQGWRDKDVLDRKFLEQREIRFE